MNRGFKRFKKQRYSLTLSLAGIVVAMLIMAFSLAILTALILIETGAFLNTEVLVDALILLLIFIGVSVIVAFVLVLMFGKFPLKPVNQLINEINRLASGDFKARLHFGRVLFLLQ